MKQVINAQFIFKSDNEAIAKAFNQGIINLLNNPNIEKAYTQRHLCNHDEENINSGCQVKSLHETA